MTFDNERAIEAQREEQLWDYLNQEQEVSDEEYYEKLEQAYLEEPFYHEQFKPKNQRSQKPLNK